MKASQATVDPSSDLSDSHTEVYSYLPLDLTRTIDIIDKPPVPLSHGKIQEPNAGQQS